MAELSLQELLDVQYDTVSTASRRRQRIWEAPASVSVVTRQEIKSFGYRTLADALGSTPGIYTTEDRNYTYLGLRGFSRPGDYNSRVLLLVDGSRANDNLYDAALIGHESPTDIEDIERVEVIRGPSSSLYGSSAFFGTVNVITRRGGSVNGIETSAEAGTFNTRKTRLAAGYKLKSGFEFYVAGSYLESQGYRHLYYAEFDAPETDRGVADNLDYERASHVIANASFRGFTLTSGFSSRTRGIPTGSYGMRFNDPRSKTTDTSGYIDLKFEHEFSSGVQLMARVGYHRSDYHGVYPGNSPLPDSAGQTVVNRDDGRGEWRGAEITVSREYFSRLKVIVGAEVRDNFRQDMSNEYDTVPVELVVDSHSNDRITGVYGQVDWSVLPHLILSAGLRLDHYSTLGQTANPRLGVIYRPWATATTKMLYGQAFRSPNAYELHYVPIGQSSNLHAQPETIETYEVVLDQALSKAAKVTASGSYYKVKDLISMSYSNEVFSFRNLERAETLSGELGIEGRSRNGWFGRLSYTAQHARDGNGMELTNSPRALGKAHLDIPLVKDRISLGTDVRYIGSARTVQPGRIGSSWVTNVTLFGREFLPGIEVSASLYNLFDQQVGNTGFEEHPQRILIQNGRSFRLRLAYKF